MDIQQLLNQPLDNSGVPDYCGLPALQAAVKRIKTYTVSNEDFVSTWATTMAKEAFAGGHYAITPERRVFVPDQEIWRKADLVVERVSNGNLIPKVYFEFKRHNRTADRFEDALAQVCAFLEDETENYALNYNEQFAPMSVFVVIVRGLQIGFFEYLLHHDGIDEDNIPHFCYAIPLTQPIYFHDAQSDAILNNIPTDVKLLFHDADRLRNQTDLRRRAQQLTTPCVFNIEKHQREINFLFHHMATNGTRF